MRVDLGCADNPNSAEEFDLYVDIVPCKGVPQDKMICADLRWRWPFVSDEVDYFRAHDIIEHLPSKIHTMNEIWRCLRAGGIVDIVVPTTDGPGAFSDPTHVSFWNRRSFLYYEDGCPYRERFAASYGIEAAFKVLSEQTERTVDGPKLRIRLEAIKRPCGPS